MSNDNFGSGLSVLYNLLYQKSTSNDTEIEIDYSSSRFYNPIVLTGLAAIIEDWKRQGIIVKNDLSLTSLAFKMYAETIGFPNATIIDSIDDHSLYNFENKTYIPIIKFNINNRQSILEVVSNIIKRQTKIESNLFSALAYFIDELTNNIAEHSGQDYGFIQAQYYTTKKYLEICMCDNGVGFFETYRRSNRYNEIRNDKDAIYAVLQGKSTKDSSITRGFGLSTSRRALVEGLNGKFFVGSGSQIFIKDENTEGVYETPNGVYYQGCIVAMRIPLQINPNFRMTNFYE